MKKTHDIVATVGEYTNKQGETKKRYVNCGALFQGDDGRMSIKLDTIPVSPDWSGWLGLFEPRQDDKPRQQQRPPQDAHNAAKANAYQPQPEDDGEIPF
jgi:hypothetical protein